MTSRSDLSARIAELLSPATPEELEGRRAHLLGLLLVAIVSTMKLVTGLTGGSAQYTLYIFAITVTALSGGVAPACVATLAAILLANVNGTPAPGSTAALMFALEGFLVAVLVGTATRRLRETGARLEDAVAVGSGLSRQVHRGRIAADAFEHLEEIADNAAVFTINAQGLIIEWPGSAARMYGFTAEQMLGSSVTTVFGEGSQLSASPSVLAEHHCTAVHTRRDGTPVHVEFQVRQCRSDVGHFTVAVHDLSRRRESDAFREAALRAQTALQRAADEAQSRLATLEALTDPSVSATAGSVVIDELLARLRSALGAEGVALVAVGRTSSRLIAGAGLRPAVAVGPLGSATGGGDGRIAVVHNDASRVAQVSALVWPATVSSILVVPVSVSGAAVFRLEIVNERGARATEWELALARIVADRLASAMLRRAADSAGAVA